MVLIAVDQLRADRVHAELPGGLGRLLREGRSFRSAVLDHAHTETCPGHATMLTGRHPGAAGVPGNSFVDRARMRRSYCVEDFADDAAVLGGRGRRSPRNLRVTTLGDWLRDAQPGSRSFAVSAKDRAAITLGGLRPDAAYWLDLEVTGRFTTSGYYLQALPEWAATWRAPAPPPEWTHPTGAPENGARRDDYPAEDPRHSRTSPHPLRLIRQLYASPYIDTYTLQFARELVEREELGRDDATDVLAVSLSGTDVLGHLYGPGSQEARDALLKLDADLDEFLRFLERRAGRGRVLVALTADHGVLELPEWLHEQGRATCPVPGGRLPTLEIYTQLFEDLDAEFGAPGANTPWLVLAGGRITLNPAAAQARGVELSQVRDRARAQLEAQPGIARVWTAEEIAAGDGPGPYAPLYRNSFDPERSGDLELQVAEGCLAAPMEFGTSHGSPYLYDRAVPLVFWGAGVQAGESDEPAATVDIAPTLARAARVTPPDGLDGRVLALRPPSPAVSSGTP